MKYVIIRLNISELLLIMNYDNIKIFVIKNYDPNYNFILINPNYDP